MRKLQIGSGKHRTRNCCGSFFILAKNSPRTFRCRSISGRCVPSWCPFRHPIVRLVLPELRATATRSMSLERTRMTENRSGLTIRSRRGEPGVSSGVSAWRAIGGGGGHGRSRGAADRIEVRVREGVGRGGAIRGGIRPTRLDVSGLEPCRMVAGAVESTYRAGEDAEIAAMACDGASM